MGVGSSALPPAPPSAVIGGVRIVSLRCSVTLQRENANLLVSRGITSPAGKNVPTETVRGRARCTH